MSTYGAAGIAHLKECAFCGNQAFAECSVCGKSTCVTHTTTSIDIENNEEVVRKCPDHS